MHNDFDEPIELDGEVRVVEIHPDAKYIIHLTGDLPSGNLENITKQIREWFLGDQHVFLLHDPKGIIEFVKVKDKGESRDASQGDSSD
jgi:hypothetical protein